MRKWQDFLIKRLWCWVLPVAVCKYYDLY